MAVPSRIFVGLTIFGLICTLLVVPITAIVLLDAEPAPDLFDYDRVEFRPGQKVFLGIASVFSIAFTWLSWRALLAGARNQQAARVEIESHKQEREQGPPPGYY